MGIWRCETKNSSQINGLIPEEINSVVTHDTVSRQRLRFQEPQQVIEVSSIDEVVPKLSLIESMVHHHGLHATGFISYEAAPAFDSALCTRPPSSFPLLWFGLYPKPDVIELPSPCADRAYTSLQWVPSISQRAYAQAISRIKTLIADGKTCHQFGTQVAEGHFYSIE